MIGPGCNLLCSTGFSGHIHSNVIIVRLVLYHLPHPRADGIPIGSIHLNRIMYGGRILFYRFATAIRDFIDQCQIITSATIRHCCDIPGQTNCGIIRISLTDRRTDRILGRGLRHGFFNFDACFCCDSIHIGIFGQSLQSIGRIIFSIFHS